MFHSEPEGHYRHILCAVIMPFWFSMKHLCTSLMPFWLSTDHIEFHSFQLVWYTICRYLITRFHVLLSQSTFREVCTSCSSRIVNIYMNEWYYDFNMNPAYFSKVWCIYSFYMTCIIALSCLLSFSTGYATACIHGSARRRSYGDLQARIVNIYMNEWYYDLIWILHIFQRFDCIYSFYMTCIIALSCLLSFSTGYATACIHGSAPAEVVWWSPSVSRAGSISSTWPFSKCKWNITH